MTPEQPTSPHSYGRDGQRWYDPNRIAISLSIILVAFVTWWGTLVYSMANNATQKNIEQDTMIRVLIEKTADVSTKLDRLLERMPK